MHHRRFSLRVRAARALLFALLAAAAPAAAETLKYDVRLFGVDVGEIEATVEGDRIVLQAESAGALYLFLRAKERIEIEAPGLRTKRLRRTYDHGGEKKGVWTLDFQKGRVRLVAKDGEKTRKRRFKVPAKVMDPATALQYLRKKAGAKKVSALLFGFDGLYRLKARRVSEKPLRYSGTFERTRSFAPRKRKPKMPPWLRRLGLGRGATEEPELHVTLSDDARRIPTNVRISDPRGSIELVLTEPALGASR